MSSAATLASSPYNLNIPPQRQLPFAYESSISNTPRDDSFASYLAVVRDNFTPEFPLSSTPTRRLPTPPHITLTRKRSDDDTEIDIFSADKYFNGSPNPDPEPDPDPDPDKTTPTKPPHSPSPAPLSKSRSQTTAWTVAASSSSSCGASSHPTLNSRDALLRQRTHDRRHGRAFHLSGLGFWCSSCSRKHAVKVDRSAKEAGIIGVGEQKQGVGQRGRRAAKFVAKEEDDRSESSSDLFEIESVAMSRAGYEPSEASIAWSVVTASAANVSVASERSGEMGRVRRKSAGMLLAGCASHKAVDVSPPPAPAAEMESSISPVVARYHVDLEAGGGGSGRIVAGRANGTSWHGGSGRMVL